MGRWQPDSRGRLQEAALALYSERGFDQTTAAQIAARAGLTERTFFRHFADKREVLFGGSALLQERIVAGVAGAPPERRAPRRRGLGLAAAAAMLGEFRRDLSRQRQAVIAANPELRERELAKLADYAAVGGRRPAPAGRGRAPGHPGRRSRHDGPPGGHRTVGERGRRPDLADVMREAMAELRAVAGGRLTGEPLLERHHQLGLPNAIRYSLFAIRYALQRSPSHGCSPSSAKSATATVSCSGFVAWLGGTPTR